MKNGLTRILFLLLTILCTGAGLSAQVAQFCSTPIPTGPVPITDDAFDTGNPQGSGLNSFGVTLSGLNASDNVTDISVEIAIDHTHISDLTAYLVAPNGRAISLFSEPGPGISGSANLSANSPITFDDDSANDAEDMGAGLSTVEAVCADNGLCDFFANADGVGQPPSFAGPEVITLLGLWDGADASNLNGQWNLFVGDDAAFDTGQIVSVDVCVTVGPSACSISNLDITGIQCGAPNGTNLDDSYATFTFDVTGGSGEYITFVYFGGNTFSGGINAAPLPTDGNVSSFAQISVGGASGGDMVTIEVADNNNQTCRSMVSAPITLPTCPVPVTAGTSTLEGCTDGATTTDQQTGTIGPNEVIWYELVLNTDGDVRIDTDGSQTPGGSVGDTEIGLYDSDGNLIESDDDGLGFPLSLIERSLVAGTYYLAFGEFNTTFGATDFDVTSSGPDDGLNVVVNFAIDCTPATVAVYDFSCPEDESADDTGVLTDGTGVVFWYQINYDGSSMSDLFDINTFGSAPTDTELGIYDSDGNLIAANDDANFMLESQLLVNLAAGTYYVAISEFNTIFGATNFDVTGGTAEGDEAYVITFELECNQPPMAVCQPVTVDADADCMGVAAATEFDGGSSDPDGDDLSFSTDPMSPFPLGTTEVMLIVSDGELSDTCTTSITVEDNTAPVITCPGEEEGDPLNYTVEAYGFSYTSIVGTGTLVASGDDNSSIDSEIFGPVALGAPVELYGMPITAVTPSTNGYITTDLADTGGDLSNDCPLPAGTSTPFNSVGIRLYPLHDDLESNATQDPDAGVYYQYFAASPYTSPDGSTTGASVFQWIGDHFNAAGPAELDFQAVLFDNGEIVYLYNEVGTEMGSGSTQGIQSGGPDPALGTTISCDTQGAVTSESATALIPQFEVIEVEEFVIGCDENSDPFLDGEGTIDGTALGTVEAGTLNWTDGTSGAIGSVTSTVGGIPAGATVTDVNFTIQADHSWVGDLELSIESPDGTSLMFLADPCNNGNSDNANVTFDSDAGPFDCQTVTSDNGTPDDCSMDFLGGASMTGSMQPQFGDLSIFNGENAAGDWRLDIVDDAGGDGGCLYTFQVEISYTAPAAGEPNPIVGAATATDNCDPNVEITFEDSTTQTMDGSCSQFTYEIFRTFIATDDAGNADTCEQIISVVDTLAPELVCSTIEVETDDLGNIELDGDDLDDVTAGTVDNCDANFTAAFSQTEFDCSDIDPETNQITVDVTAMDACGNDTMCTVNLDVAPALLDYDFACITEINVTLNEDCQAMLIPEMVLSGDFICLDLFDFDIVVMDDDPTNGPIIDGCGTFQYMITEPAPDFDVEQPDPIEGFTGPFANFVLVENNGVAAGDEATATLTPTTLTLGTVSNGVCGEGPLNGLNAEASYQFGMEGMVSFDYNYVTDDGGFDAFLISFDGAMTPLNISSDASTNGSSNIQVSPGDMIMFMVSEEDDCFSTQNELTITNFLFTFPEPTAAAFNAANFETCWGFVNAEDKTSPELEEDGEIVAPAPLYCDDLSRINVNELPNGVSRCWIQSGQTGQTLNGSMNPALRQRLLAGGGIPNFVDGCSDVEICVNDQVENIGACEDMTITRIFTARDGISCEAEAGEENAPTVYSYEIIFTRPTIEDVDAITPTAEFECNDVLDLLPPNQFGDENPTPEFDDFPFFDDGSGPVYLTESFCNLGATFRDGPRIVTCENTYKFVRTFTVIDWCEPETIRDFTQLVKVGDFDAPVITAPTQDLNFNGIPDQEEGLGPIFFSTSNPDCSANFIIPAGDADDNCDDNPEVIALIYPNGNTDGAAVGPFQVGGPAFGIPVGVHTLRYIARDACDNADTLDVPLEVGDRTAPVAICEDGLDISLGGAGQAQLCGEDIDQASYDECSDITRLIAFVGANNLPLNDAQTLALTGIAQGGWRECITLTCELLDDDPDSPDFVSVGLLVTDASQNSNSCWLDVLVEDKLPPLCVAPGPVTTTCDDEDILSLPQDLNQAAQDDPTTTFAQLDQIFGSANGLDNCPDFEITQMVVDTRNSCGVGQILRSFFVTDGEGFTSTNPCSQTITVLGIHDYTIRFPEDFGSEACVEPDYDGVTFEERGCDLITTTTRIDTFEATADECYKLRITYEVLNWCEYSTEADPYEVPRDADNDDFLEEPTWVHVLPRDESTLSDDIAYLDSDANRFNGFISPLDLHDPNGQVFGASTQPYGTDESRGAFLYRQFIKVYDDVAPEVTDVTGDLVFEDEDGNCAEPVVLTIEVDDECTTEEDYTATAQLDPFFEDIDLDGILTLADFVPTADPSLQPNVVNNNDGTFTVSFNVELPLGRHAVRLRATDGCGNAETILIIFEVIDDKAPTPVCINGLTATLMPDGNGGGMAAIWASEYVVSGGEDCTGPVKFAIYHPDDFEALDNGTLIPNVIDTGIVLDCDDEGMLIVRVYAIDGNGNADYCETTLSVQAFQPNTCEGGDDGGNIFGLIESPAGTATPNVEVSISDDGSMSQMNVTDQSGEYSFTELALGEDYTIEPTLEAEVNVATAVTTFDILLINRHILAIAELESPYQHVVADVNMDGQINVLDVVHIRMVIMGQRTDYPQGPTWRFADRDYAFSADPGNWASEAFAELHNINDLPGDILGADFYALEMGNVSEGVIAENGLLPEDGEARSRAVLTTEGLQLTAGNSYELPFRAADLYGFQGTLELAAGLELMDITYGALHAQHVNLEAAAEGLIALSYDEVAGTTTEELFRLTVRATRDGALSELLSLTDRMTRAEGYPLSGGVADLNLDFTTAPLAADEFSLGQNAPNPVDRATQIAFTLPRAATATLTVRDVQGRTLLVREIEAGAGTNLLTLRREELGAAGVLSYTLTAGEFTATKQMVIR